MAGGYLAPVDKYKDKDIYREKEGVGGKRGKTGFRQHYRNVDSNRRYVGSSAGRMLIVTQR